MALRAHDNAELPFIVDSYVPGSNPGDFQFIPGFGPVVAAPYWGQVTPFVLRSSSQYQPKAPYEVSSKKYAADFNEVKSLGAKDSTSRTQDQTEIAYFWVEGSPQGWNRIARTVAVERGLDAWENARLFGLLNMASADAYIADFKNKYLLRVLAPDYRGPRGRHRRQPGHHWRPELDVGDGDWPGAGVPVGAQRTRRSNVNGAGAVLW